MVNAATFAKGHPAGPLGLFLRNHLAGPANDPQLPMGRSDCDCQGRLHPALFTAPTRKFTSRPILQLKSRCRLTTRSPSGWKASLAMRPPSSRGTGCKSMNPRPQMIALWNRDTAYDPAEQQPVEQGKRGLANDLTCRAVLGKVVTKTPDKVLDLSAQVACDRWLKGKKETVTLNAKKTSFILDGKLAPPKIAAVAGREAVLCHYRWDKVPHKILVRSNDDSIRGMIVAMNSQTMRLASSAGSHQIDIEKDALFQVDGVPTDLQAVIKKGGELVVYPKRGRTIIAFAPVDLK